MAGVAVVVLGVSMMLLLSEKMMFDYATEVLLRALQPRRQTVSVLH